MNKNVKKMKTTAQKLKMYDIIADKAIELELTHILYTLAESYVNTITDKELLESVMAIFNDKLVHKN